MSLDVVSSGIIRLDHEAVSLLPSNNTTTLPYQTSRCQIFAIPEVGIDFVPHNFYIHASSV